MSYLGWALKKSNPDKPLRETRPKLKNFQRLMWSQKGAGPSNSLSTESQKPLTNSLNGDSYTFSSVPYNAIIQGVEGRPHLILHKRGKAHLSHYRLEDSGPEKLETIEDGICLSDGIYSSPAIVNLMGEVHLVFGHYGGEKSKGDSKTSQYKLTRDGASLVSELPGRVHTTLLTAATKSFEMKDEQYVMTSTGYGAELFRVRRRGLEAVDHLKDDSPSKFLIYEDDSEKHAVFGDSLRIQEYTLTPSGFENGTQVMIGPLLFNGISAFPTEQSTLILLHEKKYSYPESGVYVFDLKENPKHIQTLTESCSKPAVVKTEGGYRALVCGPSSIKQYGYRDGSFVKEGELELSPGRSSAYSTININYPKRLSAYTSPEGVYAVISKGNLAYITRVEQEGFRLLEKPKKIKPGPDYGPPPVIGGTPEEFGVLFANDYGAEYVSLTQRDRS